MTEKRRFCPICDAFFDVMVCPVDGVPTLDRAEFDATGDTLDPGRVLADRYRIQRHLGRGGMGHVYLASQTSINRLVAIKTLRRTVRGDRTALRRFYQEARAAATLNHPNIVHIHDFGVDDLTGTPFIAMEYLDGSSLHSVLRTNGAVPEQVACKIAGGIARGLTEAHEQGIVHRDLKPGNIHLQRLSDGTDQVKVLDFGIAKVMSDAQDPTEPITLAGVLMGTPHYMSPEQCNGRPVDYRGDLYALGCLLYHLLVGHPPFQGTADMGLLAAHANSPCPDLPDTLSDGQAPSGGLTAVYRALTAKAPDARPASSLAVANALTLLARGADHEASARLVDTVHDGWRFAKARQPTVVALGTARTEPPPTPTPVPVEHSPDDADPTGPGRHPRQLTHPRPGAGHPAPHGRPSHLRLYRHRRGR